MTVYTLTRDIEATGLTMDEAEAIIRPIVERHGIQFERSEDFGAVNPADIPEHVQDEISRAICA